MKCPYFVEIIPILAGLVIKEILVVLYFGYFRLTINNSTGTHGLTFHDCSQTHSSGSRVD